VLRLRLHGKVADEMDWGSENEERNDRDEKVWRKRRGTIRDSDGGGLSGLGSVWDGNADELQL